jgi:hypothetical protein
MTTPSTLTVPDEVLQWVRTENPGLADEYDPQAGDESARAWLRRVRAWAIGSAVNMPENVAADLMTSLLR